MSIVARIADPPVVVLQVDGRWLGFVEPVGELVAWRPDEVWGVLQAVETAVSRHALYAAGFLTYEAALAFGLPTHSPPAGELPLLWFGLFRQPVVWLELPQVAGKFELGEWQTAVSRQQYIQAIRQIKAHIAAGHTYQVNYTFPLQASFAGDTWTLFHQLTRAQQAAYMAYVDLGEWAVCSASPELFFRQNGRFLTARPMKGTAPRGRTLAEDQQNIAWLRQSEKNQAENVMIVDMIRNDLGQIARTGSVQVPSLFDVERYPTVLQMTSTVTAESDAGFASIMRAMFPCASITGAPKRRTMQIIQALESGPRGIYTGTIGYLAPDGKARFNVAIRTVTVNQQTGRAVYHVGSGIVWDSDAEAEYEECRLKAAVLVQERPFFQLLESILWTPTKGYFLLAEHLHRLAGSAEYFGFRVDVEQLSRELHQFARTLSTKSKVRLLVTADGQTTLEASPLPVSQSQPIQVGLATQPVDSTNIWLYHKTTHRKVYEQARAACPECDDVILWNERGEITEATTANVVVRLNGELVTPPVLCGLLAGSYRAHLLANGRIREQVIPWQQLPNAEELWLINSVRGWRRAVLHTKPQPQPA